MSQKSKKSKNNTSKNNTSKNNTSKNIKKAVILGASLTSIPIIYILEKSRNSYKAKKDLNEKTNDMQYFELLFKKYKNDKFIEIIINILLVIKKVRPATLYESGDFKKNRNEELFDIIKKINTLITPNILLYSFDSFKFPRILIYLKDSKVHKSITIDYNRLNNDKYIGQYLGFQCINHNFGDYTKTRISVRQYINDKEIITEVCEYNKIHIKELENTSNKLTLKINDVLSPYGFKCTNKIEIIYGTEDRYKYLFKKDMSYIKDNLDEYINDFENFYIADQKIFEKSSTYKNLIKLENLDFLSKIYKTYVIEDKANKFYENVDTHKKITIIANKLLKQDHILWENI